MAYDFQIDASTLLFCISLYYLSIRSQQDNVLKVIFPAACPITHLNVGNHETRFAGLQDACTGKGELCTRKDHCHGALAARRHNCHHAISVFHQERAGASVTWVHNHDDTLGESWRCFISIQLDATYLHQILFTAAASANMTDLVQHSDGFTGDMSC
jgi:hypothetical protein